MDSKILRKWGVKANDSVGSTPRCRSYGLLSLEHPEAPLPAARTRASTPVDYKALAAWLPPIPPFERQRLQVDVEQELRSACAVILKETTPPDADLDQSDPLEEYRQAVARADRAEKSASGLPGELKAHKGRKDSPTASAAQKAYKQAYAVGNAALSASKPEVASSERTYTSHSLPLFPQPPKRGESYKSNSRGRECYKPKPYTAASADYIVQDSSRTTAITSRSATIHSAPDPHTGLTSFSNTPYDPSRTSNKQSSYHAQAGMQAPPIRPVSSSKDNASHQAWVHTFGSRQEEAYIVPTLHKSTSKTSLRSQNGLRSRAETFRDNLREYIRTGSRGTSRASSRPVTSHSANPARDSFDYGSRPQSSSGSTASSSRHRSWWHGATGALRRKGSYNFSRNSMDGNDPNEPSSPATDSNTRVDLDKSLPPMPSLDTYVEPKVHISQLMVPAAPSVPQNSLASPANATNSPVDVKTPGSFHMALGSPNDAYAGSGLTSPTGTNTTRAFRSPALTPATENPASLPSPSQNSNQTQLQFPARGSSMQRSQQPNGNKAEPSYPDPAVGGAPRTFYSSAHQSAIADLTQFSDAWREDLVRQEEARRLKREKERQLAKRTRKKQGRDQEKRGTAGGEKGDRIVETGAAKDGKGEKWEKEKPPGLKNRLSRMFGHGHPGRGAEQADGMPERGRERTREVMPAH